MEISFSETSTDSSDHYGDSQGAQTVGRKLSNILELL